MNFLTARHFRLLSIETQIHGIALGPYFWVLIPIMLVSKWVISCIVFVSGYSLFSTLYFQFQFDTIRHLNYEIQIPQLSYTQLTTNYMNLGAKPWSQIHRHNATRYE